MSLEQSTKGLATKSLVETLGKLISEADEPKGQRASGSGPVLLKTEHLRELLREINREEEEK